MKVYTKTGDDGTTGLFGGDRVRKDDARVAAYGTVDETNSTLGLARAAGLPEAMDALLAEVQADLFVIGAELACAPGKEQKLKMPLVSDEQTRKLEEAIDSAEENLPPLKSFVLPAGSPGGAALHHARTVCRRAERECLSAGGVRQEALIYLNRLSDLLFVLARAANQTAGVGDVPWNPRGQ